MILPIVRRSVLGVLTLCTLLSLAVSGQGILSGNVIDDVSNESLPGAHLLLEGSNKFTVSDQLGNFRFTNISPGNYNVRISYVGYEPVTAPVRIKSDSPSILQVTMVAGSLRLDDVVVAASNDRSVNTISSVDIKLRPTNTSQDILRMVPGLFIAQHAGGGKAEQIFLRGFDIDHGTDINLEVDGLPVNMVSHAHGQGYSDLHFVIPELINTVDFNKGPYYADKGDFTTAGYVDFQTKNALERNFVKAERGQFGTMRGAAGFKLPELKNEHTKGYVASELFASDGYVESPQNFHRFNVMSKISTKINDDKVVFGASYFHSRWDASGQIPQRAVESGMISRFGSIDDTEGGETSRINLYVKHLHDFNNGSYFTQQAYAVSYHFNLYSNFTFFLNDSVNGDQIQQKESRMIYGYKANYYFEGSFLDRSLRTEAGAGFRFDDVDNIGLSHTVKRTFLENFKLGDVDELNTYAYLNETIDLTQNVSVTAGLRFDYFTFRYKDQFNGFVNSGNKALVSPKLSLTYQLDSKTQLYVRSGFGFHSNDARVVTEKKVNILPQAFGVDVGTTLKLTEKLLTNFAIWRLDMQQEFVYVGDEGIVEPSGSTVREGIDLSVRYEISPWLFADADFNLTKPRAKEEPEGHNYIPLAPTFSTIGGLSFRFKNGFNGSVRYRYLSDRPANEDKSIIATGYILTDATLNYTKPSFEVGISAENIFNIDWNEAQFDTTSRLMDETDAISEIHFTPGTPLFVKLKLSFSF
jgi:outer membrane receptor protein involved in Fe transport